MTRFIQLIGCTTEIAEDAVGHRESDLAFAGHDIFRRVEAQHATGAEAARSSSRVFRLDGVCAVLDDLQVIIAGDPGKRLHRARAAGEVDWNERLGPRRDPAADLIRIPVRETVA